MEEIRKLKGTILKQEVRIRELERKIDETKPPAPEVLPEENSKQNQVNNNHHEPVSILVDEI